MSIVTNPLSEAASQPPPTSKRGDWTWELVTMFPKQGEWTEEVYLEYEFDGLVEFVDGVLEFLPMPTFSHQDLVAHLYKQLDKFIGHRRPSEVYFAPIRVRTSTGSIREPDIAYIRPSRIENRRAPAAGADLVMEIVSDAPSDRERDYQVKRDEYAETGIPEYWIVDPGTETIIVLKLVGDEYALHGEFKSGSIATSVLLPGFQINVADTFAAATLE